MQTLDPALMMERYAQLDRVHGGWRRRLRLSLAASWGLRGAGAGLAGGLAVSLAALYARALVPEAYLRLLGLGAVLGAGLAAALALAWPRSSLSTAIDLDQRLGLRERLSTAVELRRRGWPGALARSQLEDTLQACARAAAEGAFLVRITRRAALMGVLLLLFALLPLWLVRPAFEAAESQAAIDEAVEQERARVGALQVEVSQVEPLDPDRREAVLRPLKTVEERLGQARTIEQALATLGEGEGQLRELATGQATALADSLRAAGERLSQGPDQDLAALGAQLAQGEFQEAAETLQQMDLRPATAAQAEAQARQLDAAAEMLRSSAPQLADALRQAAASLRTGDPGAAQQSLNQAAGALGVASQQILQAQMAGQAAGQLAAAQARLLQAAESQAIAGDSASGRASGGNDGGASASGAEAGLGQAGSSSSSGQGVGGGTGRGEGSAEIGQGAVSGSDPIAQGNAPGDGGERPYQPLQPSARLGGDGALPLSLGGSGQAGELILGMTDLAPGTPEEARVPYTDVYRRYEASARLAIDSLQPPPHLEALVREYFSSLAP